jgi:hypothetical protein
MCSIAGFWDQSFADGPETMGVTKERMIRSLAERLSILDQAARTEPMERGRTVPALGGAR